MKFLPLQTLSPVFLLLSLAIFYISLSEGADTTSYTTDSKSHTTEEIPCPDVKFCSTVSQCCQLGVDEYGWIAAAVGWSLWFLTLILLCIGKVMNLRPDEPKYNPA
ncbi:transmembrane protein 213 [Microcaecilia unicolor]|uniref:Transmembrane protein 213 n=1 Tax=Microcaecilia unicolor TaxID=1415580 RepID=A0A6P7YTD4_9AMPH|nr:transmembrane protein 213 [Microcaecilia unicolor]